MVKESKADVGWFLSNVYEDADLSLAPWEQPARGLAPWEQPARGLRGLPQGASGARRLLINDSWCVNFNGDCYSQTLKHAGFKAPTTWG